MRKLYITLLILLVSVLTASAQVILYHENFTETSAGAVAGVYAEPAGSWVFSNASPSTLAQSSKANYARTNANGQKSLSLIISTLGYSNATITWEQFRQSFRNANFPLTAQAELQYSINGGVTRTTFFTTTNTTNGTWNKVNNGTPIALPAAAMGMPEVRLYWKISFTNGNNDNAYYAIDDVTIIATPETGLSTFNWSTRALDENPFAVSGINSATPYTVDGITMRWSVALGAGVTHEIAKVDDKNFKAGTKSLTMVQLNATSTAGSIIQLDLNKAVEDLTFTVFDVDITANQFNDKLTIIGYNNGTQVPLIKNKVKTTSYNQLSGSSLNGLINNDNTSAEGDVTITFSKAVTRVVIQYNNTAAIAGRQGNGRQGIAIHNLSWRKEQQVGALPVELTTFKASKQDNKTILDWSTASEKNNEKFEIEHSRDGKKFTKIAEVAGNGTSSRKLNYTYTDSKPVNGINYYRLRQVDFDGTTAYSKTVSVNFVAPKAEAAIAQVYPTVTTSQVTVALTSAAGTTDIMVLDATGKTVAAYTKVNGTEQVVPVQNLTSGIYFVTINNGQVRETYRFLKQ